MKHPLISSSVLLLSLPLFAATDEQANTKPADETQLETLVVKGRALSHYKEDETRIGTRTDTEIDKTPQSIQVLSNTLIEDQAARQITDLYRSISGVSQDNVNTVTFRGFHQNEVLYDGMRGNPYHDFFTVPQLTNIDEIQAIKGASGALYGAGEPGGIINYVTKKPTYEPETFIKVTAGNKDYLSTQFSSSGPIDAEANHRYRLSLYKDKGDSYRNNVDQNNENVDLGYEWDINDESTLTVQYSNIYQKFHGARLRGIPTDDEGNFLADDSWNANEPGDYQQLDGETFQAKLASDINDTVSADIGLRYFKGTELQKYHELRGLNSTEDAIERQYRDQVRKNEGISLSSNVIFDFDKHTLLLGADYTNSTHSRLFYTANASELSLANPVYDADISTYSMTLKQNNKRESDEFGLLIQDQWSATNRLDVVAGARFNHFDQDYTDNRTPSNSTKYSDDGYSTRLGATYHWSDSVKPYVSLSSGYQPHDAEDQQESKGGPFDPEESFQREAGVRTYWLDNRLNINLALYHITRENVLQDDPDDSDKQIAIGKVRSQGAEVDVMADITDRWVANISYAYNDTIVDKDNEDRFAAGDSDRFSNSPLHQLGVWTRYDLPSLSSSVSVGADYVSQQYNRDQQKVKPYTVYDASWQTKWDDWTFQATIKNLTDEVYATAGFNKNIGSYVGERRRIYLSAQYDF
ncbi:TonB-dependent siderophore receptor [Marinomonas mediterranea]|uniref:TonB-dependent siderophore receptor n=1 Tax=Marinomonas mediterranea TaxID=119864 RepID=UPI002349626C|nr:TonB-dependent receptor [Marinomonas mediterranea]WCN12791.1 TonB-dependent siderophore receptor [Marinomonas mediterranea]